MSPEDKKELEYNISKLEDNIDKQRSLLTTLRKHELYADTTNLPLINITTGTNSTNLNITTHQGSWSYIAKPTVPTADSGEGCALPTIEELYKLHCAVMIELLEIKQLILALNGPNSKK